MNISEILEQLGQIKNKSNQLYSEYKNLKVKEDSLKYDLMIQLREAGLKSAKGRDFTASIAETPRVVIENETATIEWLKEQPNIEYDFYIGLKKPEFQTLAKQMLKDTGELADGTKVEVTESLAIRNNKKGN